MAESISPRVIEGSVAGSYRDCLEAGSEARLNSIFAAVAAVEHKREVVQ